MNEVADGIINGKQIGKIKQTGKREKRSGKIFKAKAKNVHPKRSPKGKQDNDCQMGDDMDVVVDQGLGYTLRYVWNKTTK